MLNGEKQVIARDATGTMSFDWRDYKEVTYIQNPPPCDYV